MKQITIAEAIQRTVEHREVFHDEMLFVMRQIMRGELTPAQIAGFIMGLRVKKETIGEIAAAAISFFSTAARSARMRSGRASMASSTAARVAGE